MTKRYTTANDRHIVHNWWNNTQKHLALFLCVMADGGHVTNKELDDAFKYLSIRRDEFEQMPYPPVTKEIRIALLDALNNLHQSLDYRRNNNLFHAQSRLNMAQANIDIVRLHLIHFGITS